MNERLIRKIESKKKNVNEPISFLFGAAAGVNLGLGSEQSLFRGLGSRSTAGIVVKI